MIAMSGYDRFWRLLLIFTLCCNCFLLVNSYVITFRQHSIQNQTKSIVINRIVRQLDELQYDDDGDVADESEEFIVRPTHSPFNESTLVDNRKRISGKISLISWRWQDLGSYFVISAFLLIAAGVKVCYHHSRALHTHVPESCVLILLGTAVGFLTYITDLHTTDYLPKFTPELFFYLLLPPIILESAYSLYDRVFFNNLGTIMLYAIVGTLMNVFLLGPSLYLCSYFNVFGNLKIPLVDAFTFATLICAVDPVAVLAIFQEVNVNKALYFLVFGESLFNDAVVITLYNTMTTFAAAEQILVGEVFMGVLGFFVVSGGGVVIGIVLGLISSLVTRFTVGVRVVEPLLVIGFAYMSYIVAELFHFSGIISLTCCGLMQAEYARHNISQRSYTTIKYLSKTLSSISDVIIFLFLGMVLIREDHDWNTSFVLLTTLFCIIFRFASVFSLTYCANRYFKRVRMVNLEEQLLMAYGGLRGAIAFCLCIMLNSNDVKQANLFTTATLFVILFSVFVLGSTTKSIVKLLRVQTQVKHEAKLFIEINKKVTETILAGIEEAAGQRSISNFWAQRLSRFNDLYIKKLLIRGTSTSIGSAYEKLYQSSYLPENDEEEKCESNANQSKASVEHQQKIAECCEQFNQKARQLKTKDQLKPINLKDSIQCKAEKQSDAGAHTTTFDDELKSKLDHEELQTKNEDSNDLNSKPIDTPTKAENKNTEANEARGVKRLLQSNRLRSFQDSVRRQLFESKFKFNLNRTKSMPSKTTSICSSSPFSIDSSLPSSSSSAFASASKANQFDLSVGPDGQRNSNEMASLETKDGQPLDKLFKSKFQLKRIKSHQQIKKCVSDSNQTNRLKSIRMNRRRHSIDHRYSKALANAFSKSAFYQLSDSIGDFDWPETEFSIDLKTKANANAPMSGRLLNRSCWSMHEQPIKDSDKDATELSSIETQSIQSATIPAIESKTTNTSRAKSKKSIEGVRFAE